MRFFIDPSAALVGLLLCVQPGSGWGNFPHIDLSWPPIAARRDIVVNDKIVSPADINVGDAFPCALIPIPTNVKRHPFPVVDGRIQLALSAPPGVSVDVNSIGMWYADVYIGQFNGDMTVSQNVWAWVNVYVWNPTEFKLGEWCADPMNATKEVTESGLIDWFPGKPGMEGVNATIGLRIFKAVGELVMDNTVDETLEVCSLSL
jgi:hypothetical protein